MRWFMLSLLAVVVIVAAYFVLFRTPAPMGAIPDATSTVEEAVRTYADDSFGVSFEYDSAQVGVSPQSTSTIAVYALETAPEEGQSIERFSKLQGETLEASIQRQILAGYSTSTCTIETTPIQNGYIRAEISYPTPDESPLGHEEMCNASYDKTNGIRYFLFDPAHPDRFYFVDIGQYPLPASAGYAWQDTIDIK